MLKLHDYLCPNGHVTESLVDSRFDATAFCQECGLVAKRQIGGSGGVSFYRENNARMDYNLGHKPVEITSERQHQKLMKEAGVALAGTRRGMKGQWI